MSATERRKGASGELEVVSLLRAHGLAVDRTARQSGVVVRGDIAGLEGFHLEVKRHEVLRLPAWQRQASEQAHPGEVPVVAYRQSRGRWWASLPLEALAELLEARS